MTRLLYLPLIAIIVFYSLVTAIYSFTLKPSLSRISRHRVTRTCRQQMASSSVVDRLELDDNFNRWRFMQNFLDQEIEASDANELIYAILDSFLKSPPPQDTSEVVSPLDTPNVRQVIEDLLAIDDNSIPAFSDPDCRPGDDEVLQKLELLLPDPRENEDAFKGSWDTVLELHGREAVKIQETKKTPEWNAICMVARVLIYFDFLTRGVPTVAS